jgi:alpha-tubulin suppressor-like RCC1 family protein
MFDARGVQALGRLLALTILVFASLFSENTPSAAVAGAGLQDQPLQQDGLSYQYFLPQVFSSRDDLLYAESNLVVDAVSAGYGHACAVRPDGNLVCWGLDSSGQATPLPGSYRQISTGANHSCALRMDGTMACWGDNTYGQASPPAGAFTQVAAGGYHTCALRANGTLTCWGWNAFQQLEGIPSGTFTQIRAGNLHSCALTSSGQAACWGWNADGQSAAPQGRFIDITAGGSHSCAVSASGAIQCWGANLSGQASPPSGAYQAVTAGSLHTCALRSDGRIACWGGNGFGQQNDIPQGVFRQISAGGQHTCGVRLGGTLACWGWNRYGQSLPPSGIHISAGEAHTCAVRVDGSLNCWGANDAGQSSPPAGVFARVSAGARHTCSLRTDGTLSCWGANDTGQSSSPTGVYFEVSADRQSSCALDLNGAVRCWGSGLGAIAAPPGPFTQITAGGGHACALRPDGSLICWGDNSAGQASAPSGTFTLVSAGARHTCALSVLGAASCWGANEAGQAAAPGGTFAQVSAGAGHTCALRGDGMVSCWGDNSAGQSAPPDGIFSQVTAGGQHSCASRLDGGLICWGNEAAAPLIRLLPANLPEAAINQPYSQQITASGGVAPYTFTVVNGQLPTGIELTSAGLLQGAPAISGSFQFTVQVADTSNPSIAGQRTYSLVVDAGDQTPPVIKPVFEGEAGKNGWYVSPVRVTWQVVDPESPIRSSEGCGETLLVKNTRGIDLTCTATSEGGTASVTVTVRLDALAPVLKPVVSPDLVLLNGKAQVEANAMDATSGLADVTCEPVDTSKVGQHSVACTAVDEAGNVARESASYTVLYQFEGFLGDVKNKPVWNKVEGGRTVPFKFRLTDAYGTPVEDLVDAKVRFTVVPCPKDPDTVSMKKYNQTPVYKLIHLGNGVYQYNWPTDDNFACSCKRVWVDLDEGPGWEHEAYFLFY